MPRPFKGTFRTLSKANTSKQAPESRRSSSARLHWSSVPAAALERLGEGSLG